MNYSYYFSSKILPNFLAFNPHEHQVFEPIRYNIINDLNLNDKSICPICLNTPRIYFHPNTCFHLFCKSCLTKWIEKKKICPMCRKSFSYILKL